MIGFLVFDVSKIWIKLSRTSSMLDNAGICKSKSNRKLRASCRAISLIYNRFWSFLLQILREITILVHSSLFPCDRVRTPKCINSVWKHKMTEFGGNCLLKMIEEALAYRLLVMLLKKINGACPKIACIVRIRVAAFQILRLGPSQPRKGCDKWSGARFEVAALAWPACRGELTDQLWVGSRFSPDLSIIQ